MITNNSKKPNFSAYDKDLYGRTPLKYWSTENPPLSYYFTHCY